MTKCLFGCWGKDGRPDCRGIPSRPAVALALARLGSRGMGALSLRHRRGRKVPHKTRATGTSAL